MPTTPRKPVQRASLHASRPAPAHRADSESLAPASPSGACVFEQLADSHLISDRRKLEQVVARSIIEERDGGIGTPRGDAFAAALDRFGVSSVAALLGHADSVRHTPPAASAPGSVATVIHLSRITVGADVLLTRRAVATTSRVYPSADQVLVGPAKNCEFLASHDGVRVRSISYPRRGTLCDRFHAWLDVLEVVADECATAEGAVLVVNLDSRLLQSGLLPALPTGDAERNYFFWDPTARVDGRPTSLADDLDRWLTSTFGHGGGELAVDPGLRLDASDRRAARAAVDALEAPSRLIVSVNLGTGGNPRKRVQDGSGESLSDFERALVLDLLESGAGLLLDRGFGPEETQRSGALIEAVRGEGYAVAAVSAGGSMESTPPDAAPRVVVFDGSVARLAAFIEASDVYVGYDSLGHHLGATLGRAVVAVFAGYDHHAFPDFWQPAGDGDIRVIRCGAGPFDAADQSELAKRVARLALEIGACR